MSLITFFDYASVIVFAITGALVASRAQLDLVGFAFIACLTAAGGGRRAAAPCATSCWTETLSSGSPNLHI